MSSDNKSDYLKSLSDTKQNRVSLDHTFTNMRSISEIRRAAPLQTFANTETMFEIVTKALQQVSDNLRYASDMKNPVSLQISKNTKAMFEISTKALQQVSTNTRYMSNMNSPVLQQTFANIRTLHEICDETLRQVSDNLRYISNLKSTTLQQVFANIDAMLEISTKALQQASTNIRSLAMPYRFPTAMPQGVFFGSSGTRYVFNVYSLNTYFYDVGGVYIFTRQFVNQLGEVRYQPLYIGKAESLADRISASHEKWQCVRAHGVNTICAVRLDNTRSRWLTEIDLLNNYKTPCNIQHQ